MRGREPVGIRFGARPWTKISHIQSVSRAGNRGDNGIGDSNLVWTESLICCLIAAMNLAAVLRIVAVLALCCVPTSIFAFEAVPDKVAVLTFDDSVASHYSVV